MTPIYKHLPGIYIALGGGIREQAEEIGKVAVGGAAAVIAAHAAVGIGKKILSIRCGSDKKEDEE